MNNILIVENELLTAERMRFCLEKAGYEVTTTNTGEEAIELVKKTEYSIVLMDIHLDGKIDGISAARSIARIKPLPVIFITELQDEEVFRNVKEVFPQNYLLKPFNDNTILYAVELALNNARQEIKTVPQQAERLTDGVFIPVVGGFNVKLLFEDILYIKANGAYADIYYDTADGKEAFYKVSISSNRVAEQLAYPPLVKVSRFYYVNIKKIEKIQKTSIFIRGREISVSDEFNAAFKKKLLFFKH